MLIEYIESTIQVACLRTNASLEMPIEERMQHIDDIVKAAVEDITNAIEHSNAQKAVNIPVEANGRKQHEASIS